MVGTIARMLYVNFVLLLLSTGAGAEERGADRLAPLVQQLTAQNVDAQVKQLADMVRLGDVTVEEFAAHYFEQRKGAPLSPAAKARWIAAMRTNFRIINRQQAGATPQQAFKARRAVAVVLYRLKGTRPQLPTRHP